MRALERANYNFWPRTAIFSTRHVRCNDSARSFTFGAVRGHCAHSHDLHSPNYILLPYTSKA